MIDHELVVRKMVLITEDLRRLEALVQKSREEYLKDALKAALVDVTAYLDHVRRFLDPPKPR